MRDSDTATGAVHRVPWTALQHIRDLPWPADEPEGLDTMTDLSHGPARGIVLALVPGLLMWAGLITLAARLVK